MEDSAANSEHTGRITVRHPTHRGTERGTPLNLYVEELGAAAGLVVRRVSHAHVLDARAAVRRAQRRAERRAARRALERVEEDATELTWWRLHLSG